MLLLFQSTVDNLQLLNRQLLLMIPVLPKMDANLTDTICMCSTVFLYSIEIYTSLYITAKKKSMKIYYERRFFYAITTKY